MGGESSIHGLIEALRQIPAIQLLGLVEGYV
jgi:hypothetical protein